MNVDAADADADVAKLAYSYAYLTLQHRRVARHHVFVVHLHRVLLVDDCKNSKYILCKLLWLFRTTNIAHTQRGRRNNYVTSVPPPHRPCQFVFIS